ncbi:hypothetical protein L211DRAFT_846126 [Terfezia boudieri ATCC MYA-4762]|uniref:Uncharacterized protein n=1 Tax=Terfezia boudieri ATCC MYA-4762 TaxID=1051890 RepID=A0A3N4LWM8_9PEZI|nr:hypothetical protein L211DRAFT_846126 [Terfezia boudieri ATCC MYA-4762]
MATQPPPNSKRQHLLSLPHTPASRAAVTRIRTAPDCSSDHTIDTWVIGVDSIPVKDPSKITPPRARHLSDIAKRLIHEAPKTEQCIQRVHDYAIETRRNTEARSQMRRIHVRALLDLNMFAVLNCDELNSAAHDINIRCAIELFLWMGRESTKCIARTIGWPDTSSTPRYIEVFRAAVKALPTTPACHDRSPEEAIRDFRDTSLKNYLLQLDKGLNSLNEKKVDKNEFENKLKAMVDRFQKRLQQMASVLKVMHPDDMASLTAIFKPDAPDENRR